MAEGISGRTVRFFFSFLMLFGLCGLPAHAVGIFRVNAASTAIVPDGSSWDNAFKTLQQGTDAAQAAGGGEVWVQAGVYTGTGSRVLSVPDGVSLYGGFAGDETAREQREWVLHAAVIDGEDSRQCVLCYGAGAIDGFVITGGKGGQGGGMVVSGGSAAVANCAFVGNNGDSGGGMYVYGSASVTNCVFRQNAATSASNGNGGGGLFNSGTNTTVMNCTFTGNSANCGGGIYNVNESVKVANCILWQDAAPYGPEIYNYGSSNAASISFSCVQGGYTGAGNIALDPSFADASGGGSLQLRSGSPCVDAGTSVEAPTADVLGRPRPQGASMDMGAYEGAAVVTELLKLDINVQPSGRGRTIPEAGVSHYYVPGEPVTLTACPGNLRFDGWTGSITSESPTVTITMNADSWVTAQFSAYVARVNAAQTGPADGKSWKTAFRTLREAVDATPAGGEVWVARGVYTAQIAPVLSMKPGVNLYGGFAGTETSREQRNLANGATVIDGENLRRCVAGSNDALLDGFTVMRGYSDTGAGMYNSQSSPTVANCIFAANTTVTSDGAGMYNYSCAPTVVNCVFTQNVAGDAGGGMYNYSASPTITNCTFSGNKARSGGGIAGYSGRSSLANCILWGNTASGQLETYASSSGMTIRYSCVQGGYPGTGITSTDPLFVDGNGGSLQLRQDSPCLGAGDPSIAPATDALGRPRVPGDGVDLGAYEGFVVQSGIVTLSFGTVPEGGGSTFPTPGNRLYAIGETVPLAAQALGHRFAGWTGDVTGNTPQILLLMDTDKSVVVHFDDNIFYVNAASSSESPLGDSWPDAFKTLQEGVDSAAATGGGSVWVAAGTYTSATNPVLAMRPGVFIYGGFAGTESVLEGRDWRIHPAFIDGEDARRCVKGADYAVLDGFTVKRGYAAFDTTNSSSGDGGGMYNSGASPSVINCAFVGNHADFGGGAMGNISSALFVTGCFFGGNQVKADSNYLEYSGGGAMNNFMSLPTITGCVFTDNASSSAGGAMCNLASTMDVKNCVFTKNAVSGPGGAISNQYSNQGTVTNCTFSGNFAQEGGGAVYDESGMVKYLNCILWNDSGQGGNPEFSPGYTNYYPNMITYSCVQGGYPGTGNISADPMFVGDSGNSVQLQSGSPCVDAGTTAGAPAADLLGRFRPLGGGVDMGAYEGVVDPADIVTLTIRVLPEGYGRTTPAAGTHQFTRGETAMVTAHGVGCHFAKWSGAVEGTAPEISLLMDGDKTVTAEFEPFVARVSAAAADSGDGRSWDTAYNSLQAAVDAVAAAGGGELWVAAGTYTATADAVLKMKPGVYLFGGFAGAETARGERDWAAHVSTIDGEDARRGVVGADDALLDGFTITGGAAGPPTQSLGDGGGMYNYKVSPTVAHCRFIKNAGHDGGGMYNERNTATVRDCTFEMNMASQYAYGSPYSGSSRFYYYGGGIYNNGGSQTVTGCTFKENIASLGAGMLNAGNTATVQECTFKNNLIGDYSYSSQGYPTGGGGVCNIDAGATVTGCIFTGNTQTGHYGYYNSGGGILNATAGYYSSAVPQPRILVENCVFLNNAIGYIGGGLCNYVPSVAVTNCTFADNTAANGDAVYNGPSYYYSSIPGSQPVLTNCILWGREDTDVQIFDYYDATSGSSLLVTYSCVQGGYSGVGNIDADPLFANADIGDLRLSAGSPCIDTGTADGAPEADILGIPRPQGAGFDMGAYEYDATPPNAPVVTGPDSPTNNPRPSFTWSSGGNGGAGLYRCGFAEGLWIVTETSETTFAPASDVSDGRYILYVQERDVAGNWSVSGTWAVTVDTVGPNAPAVRGPLSPCKNPRPVWAWSGDGGGGAHLYRYGYSEDAWLATDVTAVDLTPEEDLPDGSHTLYVQERDAAGNWSASGSFAVTVDATPPNAPAVGGAPSLTANALPEWTWVSGGNGGAGQYRFGFIENTWLAEEAATNSFTPAAPLPDGTHTLFVQERDAAGNWSASGAFTVTVDTTPPGAPVVVGSVSPPTSAKPAWTWISGGNGDIGLFRFGYAEGAWLSEAVALASFMPGGALPNGSHTLFVQEQIGRASCRERV